EQLIRADVDHVAPGRADRGPEQRTRFRQQARLSVSQLPGESSRVLDVREQERHYSSWKRARLAFACGDLRSRADGDHLAGDESDRDDPVSLGGFEQPGPRRVARRFALESDLVEPGKGVADVRLVIDGQTPLATGVD